MRFTGWVLAIVALMLGCVSFVIFRKYFSPEARLDRRRRRNNYRVVSKARRPAVRLNARTKR